ncbi:MAG: hypothetical protein SOZ32_04205 [Bacilli bacterium]|nr:hypothetical protein [Mollicutes bacterium]MDY3899391.1 hypothetical protein [Bacilli bacterium]
MEKIYQLIGQIIENSQYIEWNLALILRCNTILKEFERTNSIPLSRFENVLQEADELADELSRMTLGEIIHRVKEIERLRGEDIEQLERVLRTRNYLVHQYFKKHNIEEEKQDANFINNEVKYLETILQKMYEVNSVLVEIINFEQAQLSTIR